MAPKRKKQSRRPKGSGSIYKNKDGTYTAALEIAERLHRRRAPDAQAAERLLEELLDLRRRKIDIGNGEQTVQAWLEAWFTQVVAQRDIAPRTREFYTDMIEQYIIPKIGTMRLCDLRPDHLQTLINDVRAYVQRRSAERGKTHDGARTARGVAGVLKEAMTLAVQRKYIVNNPMDGVIVSKYTPKEIEPLNDAQMAAWFRATEGERHQALWYCYGLLGVRLGEGLALRWMGVDWDTRTIRIDQQVQLINARVVVSDPKTRASKRTLPLPAPLFALLRRLWDQQRQEYEQRGLDWAGHGLIFPSSVGTPISPSNLERSFYVVRDRAGLPVSVKLHHLRHTVATLLDEAGASEALKAGILGHGTKTVTQRYTHARIEAMRKVIDAVSERVLRKAA